MADSPYEIHQRQCLEAAVRWERAAEAARQAGKILLAFSCSTRAIKCRYLADQSEAAYEGEAIEAFNRQGDDDAKAD